ncbi:MAG: hypothetical protein C5B49_05830 [Bdellovibrio sp.]|nr:MAG: hypothetical protein C5B49_05830 [Bdellovibrio sp.]
MEARRAVSKPTYWQRISADSRKYYGQHDGLRNNLQHYSNLSLQRLQAISSRTANPICERFSPHKFSLNASDTKRKPGSFIVFEAQIEELMKCIQSCLEH